jgi:hypothetical protein
VSSVRCQSAAAEQVAVRVDAGVGGVLDEAGGWISPHSIGACHVMANSAVLS